MRNRLRRWAVPAIMVAISGCGQTGSNPNVCSLVSSAEDADACVQKWAYRLASAPGSSAQVAEAVLGGCDDAIRKDADALKNEAAGPSAFAESYAERLTHAKMRSLFYVTQGRAGRCSAEK